MLCLPVSVREPEKLDIKAIFYVIQAQVVSLRPMYSLCFYLFFAVVTGMCALEAAYAYIAAFV